MSYKPYAWWPDGTSCYAEDVDEMTHMSDDYEFISESEYMRRCIALNDAENLAELVAAKATIEEFDPLGVVA